MGIETGIYKSLGFGLQSAVMFTLIRWIHIAFQVYTLMLFLRILASWLPELYEYSVVRYLFRYTDPYLNLFRQIIPPLGIIDFSPIIAFLCLNFLEKIVIWLLLL